MKLLRACFGTGSRWRFSTLLTKRASQCVHTTPLRVSHRARRLIELWRHFSRPAIFRPREQTTQVVRRGSPSLETLLVARSRCEGSDRRGAVTEVGGLLLFCQRFWQISSRVKLILQVSPELTLKKIDVRSICARSRPYVMMITDW